MCKLAKYVRNCVVFWKNYTDDKNLTRPPVATVATNSKSVLVCEKKQRRSIVWHRAERGLEKEKEQVKLLCSWWLCLLLHSPLFLLWGPKKCRNITECWTVPVRKKAAKNHCLTQRRKRIGKKLLPSLSESVSVVRASPNLIVTRRRTHEFL